MKIKEKVYRTVVRPALVYRTGTWALKKAQENIFYVAEMRMLRWMDRVSTLDKIRNERIGGRGQRKWWKWQRKCRKGG